MSEPKQLSSTVLQEATKACSSPEADLGYPPEWDDLDEPKLHRASGQDGEWRTILARTGATRNRIPKSIRKAMNDVKGTRDTRSTWPLTLIGESGSGKTCAALLLMEYWTAPPQNRYAYYTTLSAWCERIADAKMDRLTTSTGRRMGVSEAWYDWSSMDRQYGPEWHLAVMDELNVRDKPTDHQYETLKKMLDDRFGCPTVVISNARLEQIHEAYDDRIASRLNAGTVVYVKGDQRRGRTFGG